jgi:uncharacterized protein (TIGR03083 family)
MESTEILSAACDGLTDMAERCARLVEDLADTSIPIPGSEWTVREAAAHLGGAARVWVARFTGRVEVRAEPMDKEILAARARSMLADNPESDPKKLAEQIREGCGGLLEVLATVPADQPIAYYAGLRPTVADLASQYLGEPLLHGYDIAAAVGVPWPIEPDYAAVAVGSYQRVLCSIIFQPGAAVGLEATYRVEVEGTDPFHARIAGGTYTRLEAKGPADCVISADPVTALLVISGRLSQWAAMALGRLTFTGDRPDLGPRFADVFVYP